MTILSLIKKVLIKPEEEPVRTEFSKKKESIIYDELIIRSDLTEHHDYIVFALSNDAEKSIAESIYGNGWDEMLTLGKSISFVDRWLEDNKLDIAQEASNLLYENRRNPFSDYALKNAMPKGNIHKYSQCPFNAGERQTYSKVVLLMWLENNVRPHARVIEDEAA